MKLHTRADVAKLANCSIQLIRYHVSKQHIPAGDVQLGARWFYTDELLRTVLVTLDNYARSTRGGYNQEDR